ncbi:MAG: carboxypeptidase-like regulatory domain-containing protein [Acidobacteriota bacterium]
MRHPIRGPEFLSPADPVWTRRKPARRRFQRTRLGLLTVVVLLGPVEALSLQPPMASARRLVSLQGRVLDAQTREPITKALVSIQALKRETLTDDTGAFFLKDLPPGPIQLYIGTVGYGVARRHLDLQEDTDLEILLGQESLRVSEEITVTAAPFDPLETGVVSERTLNGTELKNLANVLVDDPLRSVQSLPGVAATDDLRAQFALRGAAPDKIGLYLDGILLRSPFHTVRDIQDDGSLTVFNGDLLESVSLISGAAPAPYGDRLGAALTAFTREPGRKKMFNRATVSGSSLSFTSEGPLPRTAKVAWLLSVRKSYLDWLIRKLSEDPETAAAFGFTDFHGKLSFRPNDRHQIHALAILGGAGANEKRRRGQLGPNAFLTADSDTRVLDLAWRWASSSQTLVESSVSATRELAHNLNRDGETLYQAQFEQFAWRGDVSHHRGSRHRIEGGVFVRSIREETTRRRFDFSQNRFGTLNRYLATAWLPSGYLQQSWTPWSGRLQITGGIRTDQFSYTGESVWLPRGSLSLALSAGTRLSLAYGQYAQFPDYADLLGEFRFRHLRAERSTHILLALEHHIKENFRLRIEGYNQQERDGIFSPDAEYRQVGGQLLAPRSGEVLRNNLRGYSRGFELFLQRRSANRLAGWASYAFGRSHRRDAGGLQFDTDFDQRHTLNLYGTYRFSQSLNLSGKYRYGSNFPIVGFFRSEGGLFFLSDQRNRLRVPRYSRLDLRANKAFHLDRMRITVYGEVMNVLNRKNHRFNGINFIRPSGEARLRSDSILPWLPVAGVTIEF